MKRAGGLIVALLIGVSLPSAAFAAAPETGTGLQISPVRREIKVDPGGVAQSEVVAANLTKQDLDVTLYYREFSVANTDYDYSFQASHYNWIKISTPELTLAPGQSKTVPFTLSPEAEASPGGYYFTIFASSNIQSGGVDSTIQAASLQYVTVNGKLDKSTQLNDVDMPTVIFGNDSTYAFTMTDTGNVYYTIYSIATLTNPFARTSGATAAHIVLPDKPRKMSGSLPSPFLPGLYTATIGYRTDSGNIMTVNKQVLYLPVWAIVTLIGAVFIVFKVRSRLKKRRR